MWLQDHAAIIKETLLDSIYGVGISDTVELTKYEGINCQTTRPRAGCVVQTLPFFALLAWDGYETAGAG
jgi:hypothetical protein